MRNVLNADFGMEKREKSMLDVGAENFQPC
jgi:hypothetical protein